FGATGGFGAAGGFGATGGFGGSTGRCVGNCGFSDPSGFCYCDSLCTSAGDCCSDYGSVCGGGGTGGGSGSSCCTVHSTPGCSNPSVESCVCAFDSYCCAFDWDSTCVSNISLYGCGPC
ncbi:MAG TPA: hypothetical protein PKA88_27130, partial [Polyangiaceae bacterium]|nr:hypothetical protein [Polyangiaceae bacterium]